MTKELYRKQFSLELLERVKDNLEKYQKTQFREFLDDAKWFAHYRQAYLDMWKGKPLDLSKCREQTQSEIIRFQEEHYAH